MQMSYEKYRAEVILSAKRVLSDRPWFTGLVLKDEEIRDAYHEERSIEDVAMDVAMETAFWEIGPEGLLAEMCDGEDEGGEDDEDAGEDVSGLSQDA